MKIFQSLVCSFVLCLSQAFPILLGEGESAIEVEGIVDAPYPVAPCFLNKSISELKALSNFSCEEEQSNDSIDYWVAVCSCVLDNTFPCPNCPVNNGAAEHDEKYNLHHTTKASHKSTAFSKRPPPTSKYWILNQGHVDHPHTHIEHLSLPLKKLGNHTHSNNFIRFG